MKTKNPASLGTQAQLKSSIADWLNLKGAYAVVINVAGIPIKGDITKYRKNPAMEGMGDIIGCWGSLFFAIETKKRPKEKLREKQEEHEERIHRASGIYLKVTTIDEVIDFFSKRRTR